jgi:hypothetical protein
MTLLSHITSRLVVCVMLLMSIVSLSSCRFSLNWLYVPPDKIEPEIRELVDTLIQAAHVGDAEKVAELSMFREMGKYRKGDVNSIAEHLEASRGFWDYEHYTIDAGYTPRQAPGSMWRIVFTLHHEDGWFTTNQYHIRRFDGAWKVSDSIVDPKVLMPEQR